MSREPLARRASRALLHLAVRRGRRTGSVWGEALLGEFEETTTSWEAVRWTVTGLPVALRRERPRTRRELVVRRLVAASIAGIVVLALLRSFVVAPGFVPTASMAPTLAVGDRIVVERIVGDLHYGDLVEFQLRRESGSDGPLLKRVVGLPGDVIECSGGRVVRNGEPLAEAYLAAGTRTACDRVTVADGSVYVLGDVREASLDSRRFGAVPLSAVDGRVVARFWPLSRLGSLRA